MLILLDNGTYHLHNVGDIAMLQVAVARLRGMWREAKIAVVTAAPDRLRLYCPEVLPSAITRCRHRWRKRHLAFRVVRHALKASSVLGKQISREMEGVLRTADLRLRHRWPSVRRHWYWSASRPRRLEMEEYLDLLRRADLVVASGGGYITDSFEPHGSEVLETLGLAKRYGKPVAMLGQGIGPISSPSLLAVARSILPTVDLISLREAVTGPSALRSLGVPADHILVTGDDAIEMAYGAKQRSLGHHLGVNLRVVPHSGVGPSEIRCVRSALKEMQQERMVTLVPVPIDLGADVPALQELLAGIAPLAGVKELLSPLDVIRQIARCRVVVTGSYHGAVFALSQGIPAVGLTRSEYYENKLRGLADQFGCGCEVLSLDDRNLRARLLQAVEHAWSSAELTRPRLLAAARHQISLSRSVYRKLARITSPRQKCHA